MTEKPKSDIIEIARTVRAGGRMQPSPTTNPSAKAAREASQRMTKISESLNRPFSPTRPQDAAEMSLHDTGTLTPKSDRDEIRGTNKTKGTKE